jgi:flagellar biosynthetic protein FliQ
MNPDNIMALARETITVIILAALPIIGSGLAVGLLVSIFQATTQIQEPTLSFVPKIIVVLAAIMFFGGYVLNLVMQFTLSLWENLGGVVF